MKKSFGLVVLVAFCSSIWFTPQSVSAAPPKVTESPDEVQNERIAKLESVHSRLEQLDQMHNDDHRLMLAQDAKIERHHLWIVVPSIISVVLLIVLIASVFQRRVIGQIIALTGELNESQGKREALGTENASLQLQLSEALLELSVSRRHAQHLLERLETARARAGLVGNDEPTEIKKKTGGGADDITGDIPEEGVVASG